MLLIHCLLVLLLPTHPGQTDSEWKLRQFPEFLLDGKADEWTNIPEHYYRFDQSTNLDAAGKIGENDLQISFKTAWTEKGLHFFFDWQDDIRDEHKIGLDSGRVNYRGNSMDRMYYYDNLKIVANVNGQRVVIWFAPRQDAVQWYSYRAPSDKGHQPRHMPSPSYVINPYENGFLLESTINWSVFKLSPEEITDLQLTIILVDSDLPDKSISYKLESRQVSYVSKNGKAELVKN